MDSLVDPIFWNHLSGMVLLGHFLRSGKSEQSAYSSGFRAKLQEPQRWCRKSRTYARTAIKKLHHG